MAQCLAAAGQDEEPDWVAARRAYDTARLRRVGAIQAFSARAGKDAYASEEEKEPKVKLWFITRKEIVTPVKTSM